MLQFWIFMFLTPALPTILLTFLIARSLGPALTKRGVWLSTLICGLIVPVLLGAWAACLIVPTLLHPPTEFTDGFALEGMLVAFALTSLPVSLLTSYLVQRGYAEA